MSFQKVILAHATHEEGVLAHEAAAVLHRHDIRCTVADATNMKAAIARCQAEPVGWGDFVVIGEAARDVFPDKLKKYIGKPVKDSDYRDAVGEDLEETADKLADVLDGIASREDVDADLRTEFESSARLADVRRPKRRRTRPEPEEEYEAIEEETEETVRRRRRARTKSSNGHAAGRDGDAEAEDSRPDELTDQDLEEIGKEALDLFSAIRRVTGRGGF